jgi:hypothetical protein
MQGDSREPEDLARSLAGGLRWEFGDADVALGDTYVASVEGSVDPLGGVIAAVRGAGGVQRVQLTPSSRDDAVLLAACACASPGEPGCAHLWAVLRAIDAHRAWPRELSLPAELAMKRPDDPDLELIAEGAGVRITGTRVQGGSRAQSAALAQPAATAGPWASAPDR